MLVFNSNNLTFEDFTLYMGNPANAYVHRSQNVVFRRVDVGGGAIGIHFDVNSIGRIEDSFVYAMRGDGVLTRNKSNVNVERNWIFNNGGVGVSTVGETANTVVTRNIISHNGGPGVFAGQTPCALLPPGFVEVPACYLDNLRAYVGDANVILDSNVIQASGSTGIVLFPGTRGTFRNNHIWRNELSGLFVWGATMSSENDEYNLNEEHAIEFRAYPDPLKYPEIPSGQRIRAVGTINNNDIHDSVVLPETGTLGGGVLAQGANLDVTNSRIYRNRGIGVSYVNTSLGRIMNNRIYDNRGSGICLFHAGNVTTTGNVLTGNVNNTVGICHETTP
jgi:parallel beta-helix repeat protein